MLLARTINIINNNTNNRHIITEKNTINKDNISSISFTIMNAIQNLKVNYDASFNILNQKFIAVANAFNKLSKEEIEMLGNTHENINNLNNIIEDHNNLKSVIESNKTQRVIFRRTETNDVEFTTWE